MRNYPQRLRHMTPHWVATSALFHIRLRCGPKNSRALVDASLASELLEAAKRYHNLGYWSCPLFLLMPDHLHALLRFAPEPGMSATLQNWKRGTARFQGVAWQDNFFDHRLRTFPEAQAKWRYIRRNPVVKGLCAIEEDWPHQVAGIGPEAF